MNRLKPVPSFQLYCLMFLFRIGSLISLTNILGYSSDIRYAVLAPLIYFALSFLIAYPSYSLGFDVTKSRFCCGIYAVIFLLWAAKSTSIFALFYSKSEESAGGIWAVLLLLAAVSVFAACSGLHGISRAAVFLVLFACIFVILILFGMVDGTQPMNFAPMFGNTSLLTQTVIAAVADSGALIILPAFMPLAKSKKKRHFAIFNVLSFALWALVFYFTSGTLGELSRQNIFPVYSASVNAELGVLKRLDAVISATFVSCRFCLLATMLYFFGEFGSKALHIKSRRIMSISGGVLIFLWTLYSANSKLLTSIICNYSVWFAVVLLATVIIPFASVAGKKRTAKAAAVAVCISVIMSLCSCSPVNELDKRLIVKAIAIEPSAEGYSAVLSVLSTENADEADKTECIQSHGKTADEAISKTSLETGKSPYMGQNIAVVISENFSGDNLKDVLECLYSKFEGRSSVNVFVCKNALSVLDGENSMPPEQLYLLADAFVLAGGFKCTVADAYRAVLYNNGDFAVPQILTSAAGTTVSDAKLFNKDGICGYLTPRGVLGFSMITKRIKKADVLINGKSVHIENAFFNINNSKVYCDSTISNKNALFLQSCCDEALMISQNLKCSYMRLS